MSEPPLGVHLRILQRLAPSRFAVASECPLREVLRANGAPQLLPTSAAAHVGTIVHKLLEEAAQTPSMTTAAAESRFDSLLADEEQRMASTPDAVFVPLTAHLRDFGLRKRRAIIAATDRSQTARLPSDRTGARRATGPEVWVASPHGEVGGYIDDVVREGDTIVLRDYKSGMAAQPGTAAHDAAMSQLRLYAALYHETHGEWPIAVEIVPVDGPSQRELVDRDACVALLERACALYRWTNSLLSSLPRHEAERSLAHPAPDVCRSCTYRPVCSAYLAARQPTDDWPPDAVGPVRSLNRLGNGKISIQVDDSGTPTHVRGITPDAGRYPAFNALQLGVVVGLFNLKGRPGRYEESGHTALVPYENVT